MRLVVDNVWTWIYGFYKRGLLDPVTSYMKEGAWFSEKYRSGVWDGRIRFVRYVPERRQYRFPSGFIDRVVAYLTEQDIPFVLEDRRTLEVAGDACYELHHAKLGKIYLDRGKFSYQGRAVDSGLMYGRGLFFMATNAGKTEVGAAIIKSLGKRTVWLTHLRSLLHQTRRRLAERLQQPVGIIGDGVADYQDVTVAMVQTCSRRAHDAFLAGCRVVIGDEVHHLESDQWFDNFSAVDAPWRFGLTATPNLSQAGMNLLGMTGPIIFSITPLELIALGVSVPPRIWFASVPQPQLPSNTKYPEVYRLAIVENPHRGKLTVDICGQFKTEHKPSLVLVNQINHGKILERGFAAAGLRSGFVYGDVGDADRQNIFRDLFLRKLHTVVAVAKTVGEGVDLPGLRAIVNATGTSGLGTSSEEEVGRATTQFFGRGLRADAGKHYFDYVDFVDACHKYTKGATAARLNTLTEQGYSGFVGRWEDYKPLELSDAEAVGSAEPA